MAETDLGGIVVEISADVKGLLDGSQQAVESLKAIEKSSGTTATGMNQLNATSSAVAAALLSMTAQGKQANALLEQIALNLKRASEPQGDGISQASRQVAALAEQVKIAQIALDFGGRAAAQYAARIKMAGDASAEEKQQMIGLAGRLYDMRSGTETAGKSMGNMRGIMQQAGYQIGDFAVQVQSGQNALVAFSQQGSQLAGAFGPVGAVVGVVLTLATIVGGQLMANMTNANNASKDLDSAMQGLNQMLTTTTDGAKAFSDEFIHIAQVNKELADALRLTAELQAARALKEGGDAAKEAASDTGNLTTMIMGAAASTKNFNVYLGMLGVTASDYDTAMKQVNATGAGMDTIFSSMIGTLGSLQSKYGGTNQEVFKLAQAMNTLANSHHVTQDQIMAVINALRDLTGGTDAQSNAASGLIAKMTTLAAQLFHVKEGADAAKGGLNQLTQSQQDAERDARQQLALSKLTGAARAKQAAIYAAENQAVDKNSEATKAHIKLMGDLAYQTAANQEAQKAATRASNKAASEAASQAKTVAKAHAKDAENLKDLQAQTDLTTASTLEYERAKAVAAGQNKMSQYASPDQVKQAGDLAGKIWDQTHAMQAQQQAQQLIDQNKVAQNPLSDALIQAQQNKALDQLDAQHKLGLLASEQQYQDARNAIIQTASDQRKKIADDERDKEYQAIATTLGAASSAFDSLATLAASAAGKNSGAYKAMFAMSKGFAIAQATVALNLAILQAMAAPDSLSPAQKFTNMAAVATAGAGVLQSIVGAGMGGGKKYGGGVNASTMYRTGENGPEIYQANNGNQYMIPGQRGQVIPTGSGGPIQQNITFSIQTTGGIDDATMTRMAQMMKQVSLSTIKDQQRPNGLLQRSR